MALIEIYINSVALYVTSAILLILNYFVYTPIVAFYCIQFWKMRNEPFFKKRHPYFILAIVIGLQLWMCIAPTLNWIIRVAGNKSLILFHFSSFVKNIVLCLLGMILVRFFWLYFDYSHALQLKTMKWKQNIVHHSSLQPWTLKYKYLSDVKFLFAIVIIFTIISEILLE